MKTADRIRIAHIITKLELGGAQQNTLYTVSHLEPSKFEAHLITGCDGVLDEEARKLPNVSTHFLRSMVREIHPWKDLVAYRQLKDLLKTLNPAIVHTHSSKAGVLGRLAAAAARVPVIIHTYHGFGFHRFQSAAAFQAYVRIERFASRRAHHLIFVSRENWNWAKELGLLANCGASLIRSGVAVSPLAHAKRNPSFRVTEHIPEDAKIVGMVACLKPQKDPLTFVRAADLVTSELPDVHFVLAGDGELHEQVLDSVRQMKHPDRFHLLSWRRDIPELLAELNISVLSSRWEGLPRVIPEATIAGVPVVASDIDGNREVVVQGKNGELARVGDASDFAEKILAGLHERWRVDAGLQKHIQSEFDIDGMVSQQQDLYLDLLSKQSGK